jgi:hypothetical protein
MRGLPSDEAAAPGSPVREGSPSNPAAEGSPRCWPPYGAPAREVHAYANSTPSIQTGTGSRQDSLLRSKIRGRSSKFSPIYRAGAALGQGRRTGKPSPRRFPFKSRHRGQALTMTSVPYARPRSPRHTQTPRQDPRTLDYTGAFASVMRSSLHLDALGVPTKLCAAWFVRGEGSGKPSRERYGRAGGADKLTRVQ